MGTYTLILGQYLSSQTHYVTCDFQLRLRITYYFTNYSEYLWKYFEFRYLLLLCDVYKTLEGGIKKTSVQMQIHSYKKSESVFLESDFMLFWNF